MTKINTQIQINTANPPITHPSQTRQKNHPYRIPSRRCGISIEDSRNPRYKVSQSQRFTDIFVTPTSPSQLRIPFLHLHLSFSIVSPHLDIPPSLPTSYTPPHVQTHLESTKPEISSSQTKPVYSPVIPTTSDQRRRASTHYIEAFNHLVPIFPTLKSRRRRRDPTIIKFKMEFVDIPIFTV